MTEEHDKMVLRQSELRTMINLVVSNVRTMIDDKITSTVKALGAKSRPSTIGAAVSTAIVTVIEKRVSGNMTSELGKHSERQTVTSQDVISTAAHECIGCDELMVPTA